MDTPTAIAPPATAQYELVPLDNITPSKTNPRKTFNGDTQKELADSIRKQGVLQPILLRPYGDKAFDLVCGERRWRAAKAAGLTHIPAMLRTLDDKQVLEIQVIENLQRDDIPPIEEAEGYQRLVKSHGYTPEDIAAKIGKGVGYVWARMKLNELCEPVRKLLHDGTLTTSVALLIARIPNAKLQADAARECAQQHHTLTAREAAEHIRGRYMLQLKTAPFDTGDATLLPQAGACGTCPRRTGNQRVLFGDVKGDDVCTDPKCFEAKADKARVQRLAELRAQGKKVIEGKEAKAIKPHNWNNNLSKGWLNLDAICYDEGAKCRTYRALLGADCPEVCYLDCPHTHKIIEIVPEAAAKKALRAKGIGVRKIDKKASVAINKHAANVQHEEAVHAALFSAIHARLPGKFDHTLLRMLCRFSFDNAMNYERIGKQWNWPDNHKSSSAQHKYESDWIAKASEADLTRMVLDVMLDGYIDSAFRGKLGPELSALCKHLKVDAAKVRTRVQTEQKALDKAKADAAKVAKAKGKNAR